MCCCRSGRRSSDWATACSRCCAASMPAPWRDCRSRPAGWPGGSAAARCWQPARRSPHSATFWRGFPAGLLGLCAALVLSGAGSSTQHPIASAAVSRAYGRGGARAARHLQLHRRPGQRRRSPRRPALLLTLMPWRPALWLLAGARVSWWRRQSRCCCLRLDRCSRRKPSRPVAGRGRGGFPLLFAIGVLDTGVRMGLLTFLPFLLKAKGATLPTVGLALALVFIGGAAGKFACGWLGGRVGVLWTVLLTEGGTAVGHPRGAGAAARSHALSCCRFLGVMLNGRRRCSTGRCRNW